MTVGEDQAVGVIGVARDPQLAPVVQAMVAGAQRHQVGGVGGTPVLPAHLPPKAGPDPIFEEAQPRAT